MRITTFCSDRAPAIIGSFCIVIATGMTGCASKNPLMEEPVPASASASRPASSSAPTATTTEAKPAPAVAANSSVHTSKKGRFLGFLSPYRVDIQQGNFVSREMVAQLKEGMTPDQVRFVMGTPLLTDIFHKDRWDYPFRLEKRDGEVIESRVTIFFKDNRLARVEGGNLPSEESFLGLLAGQQVTPPPAKVEATPTPAPAPVNK